MKTKIKILVNKDKPFPGVRLSFENKQFPSLVSRSFPERFLPLAITVSGFFVRTWRKYVALLDRFEDLAVPVQKICPGVMFYVEIGNTRGRNIMEKVATPGSDPLENHPGPLP